ncbi:MAG: PAS domain S-box protein [Bacteroidales bacterium]|nr:PAS domain S-box protein [Bacteroidales bacterium]MCF8455689.1 PAS domain S-box protein [Bacteroidales bacterium]
MNYSSVSHLSHQFKKVTGLSPSHFKQLKDKRRIPIEEIGNQKDVQPNTKGINQNKSTSAEPFPLDDQETLKPENSNYARSLIEASLDPFVTINFQGKITDVNKAMVQVTGIPREKLINTDFSKYFTEPQKAQASYLRVFEKGFVADCPLTIKHKNGNLTDVSYNASVYKDEKGNVLGVFAAARDVTDKILTLELRKTNKELAFQLEEKEKRAAEFVIADRELAFQTREKEKREIANIELEAISNSLKLAGQYSLSLIEASLDPLVTISTEGKITDMNEATVNITGFTREKLTGTNFLDYFTEPQKAREVYLEVFAKGSVADSPLTIRHKDGKLTDVLFNGSVYKDDRGNVQGVVIVARDVTDQKRIATELTEAIIFAEMATLIAEEAKSKAEKATLFAEDAMKAKQQFLSNMSHEIRTPMNAIIGFTKVILKTDLSAKQKEYLKAIKLSGDALIVLINDILDLAKVDAGKMTFEQIPFKMDLSLSAMLHLFETKIQEKNLKLIKEYDPKIPEILVGDPVRLHQIILNLVSNAVKFTSKGKITVSVQLLDEDEESVRIEFAVKDTGIGIVEAKIESIFDNFQQASSNTSRLYGGTGLGLAIVKQLVERQGGTIRVTSKVNEGSTISFILNFRKVSDETVLEIEPVEFDTENADLKVLVVEDIVLNQLLMRTLLDDFGFECDIADNGKIAIEKMQSNLYDIVLMDLQMPEMNGFEATEYIRNIMHSTIPIIALTADVTTVDLAKCKEIGMNDYIAKPIDEKLLYSKMVGLVKKTSINSEPEKEVIEDSLKNKCTNLDYLNRRTKSNPVLMMEMISLFLTQTPALVSTMKQGLKDKDWQQLYSAVHKLIPSFSIMGIGGEFESMALKVQDFARIENQPGQANMQENLDELPAFIEQLENMCLQACEELELEFNAIKNTTP